METSDRVECANVEVVSDTGLALVCRIGDRVVVVPPLHVLEGSTVRKRGERGKLVLPRRVARDLGIEQHCG